MTFSLLYWICINTDAWRVTCIIILNHPVFIHPHICVHLKSYKKQKSKKQNNSFTKQTYETKHSHWHFCKCGKSTHSQFIVNFRRNFFSFFSLFCCEYLMNYTHPIWFVICNFRVFITFTKRRRRSRRRKKWSLNFGSFILLLLLSSSSNLLFFSPQISSNFRKMEKCGMHARTHYVFFYIFDFQC